MTVPAVSFNAYVFLILAKTPPVGQCISDSLCFTAVYRGALVLVFYSLTLHELSHFCGAEPLLSL